MFASAEEKQTLEDATASLNNESASATGDSDTDPNCSLSDYSYSDTSDDKSSSFDEVNVSTLNEPRNIDLTTEKENRKPNSRKKKNSRAIRMGGGESKKKATKYRIHIQIL
jgi:hypothetical protein